MPQVLVRDVDDEVLARLKERARMHHRSLQAELTVILGEAAIPDPAEFRELAAMLRKRLADRPHTDSVVLLREGREC